MKPTADDVLKWAREADFSIALEAEDDLPAAWHTVATPQIETLAALAYAAGAADMKERCAKEFDRRDGGLGIGFYDPHEPAEIIRALPINPLTAMNRAAEQNGEEL